MKFERVEGNVPVFSGEYEGRDRTIFGGTEQSNDINQQFTPEFKKGWGIVGKNEFPTLQDFNALGFTHSALIGYLYQSGVAQWVAGADYYTGSIAVQGVDLYVAIQDKPTSQPSSLQGWRLVSPALLNTTGNSTSAPMTQKAVTDALAKKWDIQTTTGSGNVARMSEVQKKWDIQQTVGSGNIVRASELDWSAPVGMIVSWDHAEAPKNWLFVRDQKFSATEYPELAKLYPNLTLNDRRGTVDRALDAGRGFDPGRVLGSYQGDAMQKITGTIGVVMGSGSSGAVATGAFFANYQPASQGSTGAYTKTFDSSRVARTANETRMKNVATNKIIKAR